MEESWERAIAQQADHFIATTEPTLQQFIEKHPSLHSKTSVLTNGFDTEDFHAPCSDSRLLPRGHMHLTLTGSIEPEIDMIPIFQAVKDALEENPGMRSALRINFIGTKRREQYDQYIQDNALTDQINYVAYVPHSVSVQYLAESHVLFLNPMIPTYESGATKLPGKLFEYLYMRKPILALTIKGVAAGILEKSGLGIVIHPTDVAGIKNALADLYQQWQQQAWKAIPDDAVITQFDRVRLTERLAEIFDQVVGSLAR